MPAPRKPKKVFIQFAVAFVIAIIAVVGAGVLMISVMGNNTAQVEQAKKEAEKVKQEAEAAKEKYREQQRKLTEAQPKKQLYKTVVALVDIVPGQPITKDMVDLQESDTSVAGALTQKSDAVSKMVKSPILKGEPILTAKLLDGDGFLSVNSGMRAVTISVDSIGGVGGAVSAGVHVDVMTTITNDEKTITKTLLQNVQVIAVADDSKTSSASSKNGNGVTLAVTPPQAELLALSQKLGTFHLSLRNFNDKGKSQLARGTDINQLITDLNPIDYRKSLPKPPNDTSMDGMQNVNLTGDTSLPSPGAASGGEKHTLTIYKGPGSETVELSQ